MICPKCGKEIRDESKFCKFCGLNLNNVDTSQVVNTYQNINSENKKKNIIIVTLIAVVVIIAITGILLVSGVFNDSGNSNTNIVSPVSDSVASGSYSNVKPLEILGGSFSTGTELNDLTYGKIFVGKQHAGEHVYISAVWSRNGNNLNNGEKLSKTVDSNGYINFNSGTGFKYFPDYVVIKLYYANGDLAHTQNVRLNPSSGTQTF